MISTVYCPACLIPFDSRHLLTHALLRGDKQRLQCLACGAWFVLTKLGDGSVDVNPDIEVPHERA